MGASLFVGRVGVLAVALGVGVGVGAAVLVGSGVASAETADAASAGPAAGSASAGPARAQRSGAVRSGGVGADRVGVRGAAAVAEPRPAAASSSRSVSGAAPVRRGSSSPERAVVARAAVVAGQGATDGITVAPTVEFVDAIVQGTLNATSSRFGDTSCSGSQSSSCLTYEFVSKDGFGKLDLDTVPAGPLTDPQSFTILPYLTWDLDTGAGKGTQTFQVRVTEVTDFDAFVTGLPLIGLLAGPLIGLLQQAPLVGSLLAPVIGASTVAEISVDMATLAPGATPAAFTYKVPSFDGVLISTNFFPAADIQPGIQSPLVLNGPGLGAAGVTNPYVGRGTEQFVPGPLALRDANYNLITWDPRGEFASEGVLQLDNPFYEGRDASAIISWAAQNPGGLTSLSAVVPRPAGTIASTRGSVDAVTHWIAPP